MSKKTFRIVNLILAILVCVFSLGYAFAWVSEERREAKYDKFGGSSNTPYFKSGSGASNDPFIISNRYHCYNLAWLQNTGKLNDQKYYFKLEGNFTIREDDFWLPPIGTDNYPFIGDFNGNGATITGLKITTDTEKLSKYGVPINVDKFSNAVGMFGMTGGTAEIHNLILNNPIVEVADNNAYNTDTGAANLAVGIAVGHVALGAKVYSVGVLAQETNGANLQVNKSGYSTFNSILGELDEGIDFSVTGGGHISGKGGDTGQFIPDDFVSATSSLTNVMINATQFKANTWILPYNDTVADGAFAGVGLGAFSFLTGDTVELDSNSVSTIKYYSTYTETGGVPVYGTGTATEIKLDTKNLKEDGTTDEAKEAIRNKVLNGADQITQFNHFIYLNNSPEKDDENPTPVYVYYETNNPYVNKEGSSEQPTLKNYNNIYDDGIKVNVTKNSTKIFVIAANRSSSDARSLGVYKISDRTDDFKNRVEDSAYEEGEATVGGTKYSFNKLNPLQQLDLPTNNDVVACEFSLKNTGPGTYMINSKKGGINVYYLAVTGTTQGDNGSENGAIDNTKAVSAVDFIYDGVTISQADDTAETPAYRVGDFIVTASGTTGLYTATGTSIFFENLQVLQNVLKIAYIRPNGGKNENNNTLIVEVTPSTDSDVKSIKQTQTTAVIRGATTTAT